MTTATTALEKTRVLVRIDPTGDPDYMRLKAEVDGLCRNITDMEVHDQEEIEHITRDVNLGIKVRNEVEALRKVWKKPALTAGRRIDAGFDLLLKPLDEIKKVAGQKVTICKQEMRAEQARIEAENRRLEAERQAAILETVDFETGEIPDIPLVVTTPTPIVRDKTVTELGSERTEMEPRYRLVDITKVPTGLLMLDEKQVKAQLKAGVRDIPGLEIWEEEVTKFRAR